MPNTHNETPKKASSHLDKIAAAAKIYGDRSFDNYAQIRSVSEAIRDGLCAWLDDSKQCVYLVPPQGPFTAQNYRSAAYSVSGKGFLPLEPISFGLAINISGDGDYMRLVMTCRKEGAKMFIHMDEGREASLNLPVQDAELATFFERIYEHLLHWFEGRVDQYDNGSYGSNDMGFDIQRVDD